MFYIDRDLLNLKIRKANTTADAIAAELGIDRGTWYRHLRKGDLTISEIHEIVRILKLTTEDILEIFFAKHVAPVQQ